MKQLTPHEFLELAQKQARNSLERATNLTVYNLMLSDSVRAYLDEDGDIVVVGTVVSKSKPRSIC
jgi:hypothetical protein